MDDAQNINNVKGDGRYEGSQGGVCIEGEIGCEGRRLNLER